MKLIGIMPARNESWCLGLSARVALLWCDELVILNHASTDATGLIIGSVLTEYSGRIFSIWQREPVWSEMAHRQHLLEAARQRGATHIAMIDADEILTANLLGVVRQWTEELPTGTCLQLPMRCMWRGMDLYRADTSVWGTAITSVAFADRSDLCWRTNAGYEFHHREPFNSRPGQQFRPTGGVLHLQFADWRRLTAKHALYKMIEVLRWPGRRPVVEVDAQYNMALDERNMICARTPPEWLEGYDLTLLDLNQEPWQEAECRRLWDLHGADKFVGLNLFGVVTCAQENCVSA